MLFGDIPESILNTKLKTPDYLNYTLRDALEDSTNEDIINARWICFNNIDNNNFELNSFTAWTEHDILMLIKSPWGDYIIAEKRDPVIDERVEVDND